MKKVLKSIGILVAALMIFCVACGSSSSSASSTTTTEEETTAAVEETEETTEAEPAIVNQSKSGFDIATTMANAGALEDAPFTLVSSQVSFIDDHQYLFPVTKEEVNLLEDYIDYDLDYSHMIKNPEKYAGTFAYLELIAAQVVESDGTNGDYSYITLFNSVDNDGNLYYVWYIGESIDVVEGDDVRLVAMPIANTSYVNLSGDTVMSLVMLASYADNANNENPFNVTTEAVAEVTTETNDVVEVTAYDDPRDEGVAEQALATHGISIDTIRKIIAKYRYDDEYTATLSDYECLFYFEDSIEEWNYKITEDEWGYIDWQSEEGLNTMRLCLSADYDPNTVLTVDEVNALSNDDLIGLYGLWYHYELFNQDDPGEGDW